MLGSGVTGLWVVVATVGAGVVTGPGVVDTMKLVIMHEQSFRKKESCTKIKKLINNL